MSETIPLRDAIRALRVEILEAVETRQLEGSLRMRDEAIEWVKREYLSGKEK